MKCGITTPEIDNCAGKLLAVKRLINEMNMGKWAGFLLLGANEALKQHDLFRPLLAELPGLEVLYKVVQWRVEKRRARRTLFSDV